MEATIFAILREEILNRLFREPECCHLTLLSSSSSIRPDHDQQHLECRYRLQGVGLIGRHDDDLALFHPLWIAGDADLHLSVQHLYHGIEGRRVLAEPLPLIKGKQGHRSGLFIDDGFAHHRIFLIIQLIGQIHGYRCFNHGHFSL